MPLKRLLFNMCSSFCLEKPKRKHGQLLGKDFYKDLFDYLTGAIEDSVHIEHDESSRSMMKRRKSSEKGTVSTTQQSKHTRINGQISMEIASRDRNQLLTSPGIDYTYALKLYEQAHLKQHSQGQEGGVNAEVASLSSVKKKKDYRLPIIIVPSTATALMSMFNIKKVHTLFSICLCFPTKLFVSISSC